MRPSRHTRLRRPAALLAALGLITAACNSDDVRFAYEPVNHSGEVAAFASGYCQVLSDATGQIVNLDGATGADVAATFNAAADAVDTGELPDGGRQLLDATRAAADTVVASGPLDTLDGEAAQAHSDAIETIPRSVDGYGELASELAAADGCTQIPWGGGAERAWLKQAAGIFVDDVFELMVADLPDDFDGSGVVSPTPSHIERAAADLDGQIGVFYDPATFPGDPQVQLTSATEQLCVRFPDPDRDTDPARPTAADVPQVDVGRCDGFDGPGGQPRDLDDAGR